MNRKLFIILLLSISLISGCYGPFKLTRRVWKWNGTIEEKFGREAVFLVFCILPVYGLTTIGDALVLNTIDFWGGNSVQKTTGQKGKRARMIHKNNESAQLIALEDRNGFELELSKDSKYLEKLVLRRTYYGAEAFDSRGRKVMSVYTGSDGSLVAVDPSGRVVSSEQ